MIRALLADIRRGQQGTVQQGLDAVMFQHRSARHLANKAGAEHALDRTPGMIRAKREEKSCLRIVALQRFNQARHAFARAAMSQLSILRARYFID
jgi:hypothetical protein